MDYIPIVISFDKKYLFYAKIAVNFILNRTKRKIKLYAFALDIDDSECSYFKELLEKNSGQFEKINFKAQELKHFKEMHYFGMATYLRLFIPKFVKEDKAIYMDCDVVTLCDVEELYQIEFDGANIIAVEDSCSVYREKLKYDRSEALDLKGIYFNAGLIVLNNKSIRETDFENQIQEINRKYSEKIYFADQCILNKLFENSKKIIDWAWNYQFNADVIDLKTIKNAKFAHSIGHFKYWHRKSLDNRSVFINEVINSGYNLNDIFKEAHKDQWHQLQLRINSNMDNQIKVVFCFDENYVEYAKTAIKSLLRNKNRNIFIYMIAAGVKQEDLIDIISIIYSFDTQYEVFHVDYSKLDFCKPMAHLKMPTYLRLLIPSLIPEKKIIYLDCDTYINGDLGELFDLDIKDNVLAVVKDDHAQEQVEMLNLKSGLYSNAGVLRWDLDKVNRANFIEECKNIYIKYEKALKFGDQCILNVIYDNKKTTLNREWNEQVLVHHCYFPTLEYFMEHERKVIHFCGPVKPWECDFGNAGWRFWHKYMA